MATGLKRSEAARIAHYTRNVLHLYGRCTKSVRREGATWYAAEHDKLAALAAELGADVRAVCGAAAAISPGMRWDMVGDYVRALHAAPDTVVPTYSQEFTRRAVRCLRGEYPEDVLGGLKVRAFFALLSARGQSDAVVIDGHAFNIARARRAPLRGAKVPNAARVTAARYRWAAEAYRRAAEILGVAPHVVQAATWLQWRELHGVA